MSDTVDDVIPDDVALKMIRHIADEIEKDDPVIVVRGVHRHMSEVIDEMRAELDCECRAQGAPTKCGACG